MSEAFEGWAIVELMGHRRLGAYVREAEFAGAAMLRLDIPEHPWVEGCTCGSEHPASVEHEAHTHVCAMFRDPEELAPLDIHATQFYNPSALYCLTPTTEEMARAIRGRPEPVREWELPGHRFVPALEAGDDEDEDQPF